MCFLDFAPCLRDPVCPQGFSWEEEAMEWGHNCFLLVLMELVQRRTGLCLLLLLVNYLGCWLPPSPALSFCILLSHDPIVALHPLTLADTQGYTLFTKFPALLHFIFPFPVQPLEKLLLSLVTTFASLDILFIFICFLLLYVFSCLLVGSITGQEVARHFYRAHDRPSGTFLVAWDMMFV